MLRAIIQSLGEAGKGRGRSGEHVGKEKGRNLTLRPWLLMLLAGLKLLLVFDLKLCVDDIVALATGGLRFGG